MANLENLNYQPRIGVFGKSGVGKSSLCNALFGSDICPISDISACTRNPQEVLLKLGGRYITLIDVPGVGESAARDEEYGRLYASLLPELDLILWVLKADERALATDENFYKNVVKPHIETGKPFFFVLNQVDKIEPFREWDVETHEPGPNQLQNIDRKVQDIGIALDVAASKIIPVSAKEKFNLVKLVDEFVRALPTEKRVAVFKEVKEEIRSYSEHKSLLESIRDTAIDVVCDVTVAGLDVTEKVVLSGIEAVEKAVLAPIEAAEKITDFVSGKGCFITTAVCENAQKPDDCYELTTFRSFRDNWLTKQPGGQAFIQEYYQIAPTIVEHIDRQANSKEIYQSIWDTYLVPCLDHIEKQQFEECKRTYITMVNNLKEKFG